MSQRYHRGYKYQTRNLQAAHSPLRSIPLLRPAAAVFGTSWYDGSWNQPKMAPVIETAPAPFAPVHPERALANAEASLRDAQRAYDGARRVIGEANRTHSEAVSVNGRVVMPARPFTNERVRERKSAAFKLFNKRRSELATAKRVLAALQGVPALTKDRVTAVPRQPVQAIATRAAPTLRTRRPAMVGLASTPSPAICTPLSA